MHSVGIEPTLFRTCALSMRLNRSAMSAFSKSEAQKELEEQGIDPCASCMQSTRSTIWATPPMCSIVVQSLDMRAGADNHNYSRVV